MKQSLATAEQAVAMDVTQEGAGLVATVSAGPFTWPERHLVDDLTRFMSEQAIVNRLAFRTLSISHTAPSAQAWGMVSLEVVASGAYGDVKNWQGGLLARYPSLAVRSLGLQPLGSSIHADGLEARMTWVLYVRD
ncbi:MAG: hypothetical protein AB7S86_05810 [Hydrogenophaga sp.]|uniref:hypothetical protein n=1 Tax=Hydrogenophaga sp. TaxID=1904254 RepID=UPI003D121429